MDTYSQLAARAKRIGYHITKVVYRGYEASASLQATHDNAVQTRTHIRLNKEAEEKEQVLLQFKLKREKQRTKLSESGYLSLVPSYYRSSHYIYHRKGLRCMYMDCVTWVAT